jgi:hypothetical protein
MSNTQNKQSIPTTVGSGASSPYVATTRTKRKGPNLAFWLLSPDCCKQSLFNVEAPWDYNIHQQMHKNSEILNINQCELCQWTPATLNKRCFNMLWRTKQKRVGNTHIQNNVLRVGVVRTDIDDNIHQRMHQNSDNDAQYQCELCHWTPATLNNHCFNMLWRTKQ